MKFCLERGSSGRRARSWDLVLRSWPVDLIGGRRPCNTWCWLQTMAEKRVSSARPQSSDSGGVDSDKNPSLWALDMTAWRRCLSRRSKAPPDWWSVQHTVDKYGLPNIPERDAIETLRLQNSEGIKGLGTAANEVFNMGFEGDPIVDNDSQYHHLAHSLYSRNRGGEEVCYIIIYLLVLLFYHPRYFHRSRVYIEISD